MWHTNVHNIKFNSQKSEDVPCRVAARTGVGGGGGGWGYIHNTVVKGRHRVMGGVR